MSISGNKLEVPSKVGLGLVSVIDADGPSHVPAVAAELSDEGTVYIRTQHVEATDTARKRLGRSAQTESGECSDPSNWANLVLHTYPLKWFQTYTFYVDHGNRPGNVTSTQFQNNVIEGALNWFQVHNNCGAGDGMGLSSAYGGTTSEGVNWSAASGCRDPYNNVGPGVDNSVVKFQSAGAGTFRGVTCIMYFSGSPVPGTGYQSIKSADVVLNADATGGWTGSLLGCGGQNVIENIFTHEVGHVLGFAHVNLANHTMYPNAAPLCVLYNASLSRGDYLGANTKY